MRKRKCCTWMVESARRHFYRTGIYCPLPKWDKGINAYCRGLFSKLMTIRVNKLSAFKIVLTPNWNIATEEIFVLNICLIHHLFKYSTCFLVSHCPCTWIRVCCRPVCQTSFEIQVNKLAQFIASSDYLAQVR